MKKLVVQQAFPKGPLMAFSENDGVSHRKNEIVNSEMPTGSYEHYLDSKRKDLKKPIRVFAGVKRVNGELVVVWKEK